MRVNANVREKRWSSRNRTTPREAAEALTRNHGQLSFAAKDLGVSVSSLSHMIRRHELVARARNEAKEKIIDKSTINVAEAVMAGDLKASLYVLSTIGRHRDWRLPSGNDLNIGDQNTVNNTVIQQVVITAAPSGSFIPAPVKVIEPPAALVIDQRGVDEWPPKT
jgi:hypothetical protein